MKDEEEWCLNWLGTKDVRKALQPKFLDEVYTEKYVEVNQQAAYKGKGVADEGV